ncbi:MAG: glycosyltransferase [Candidatus Eisenbacteria bacterium]|nr:glycosyltransferase [Candidatus Eisenbacteria bacterium]
MKVLAIYALPSFWSMGEGKGATAFSRTLEALARAGHQVDVSLPAEPAEPSEADGRAKEPGAGSPSRTSLIESFAGCALHRTSTRRSFLPDANLPLLQRLWSRWENWRAYQSWGYAAAVDRARAVRPDLVLALGVFEAPVARRLAVELGVANATRLFGNNLSLNLGDPLRYYANFPEIAAFRTRTQLLLLTNDGANGAEVVRRCRVDPGVFHHLRNGLEFDRFAPGPRETAIRTRLGLAPGDPLLITVTRLADEKKLERAIATLKGLRDRYPGARLALLGDGPERATLERAAEAMQVSAQVDFVGAVHQAELPEWYRSADFVLSLLDRTNASNPVFEAMACARVVAALDVGTTREVVQAGRTGVLLRTEDLPQLGAMLAALFADRLRMEQMGRAAHDHIRTLLVDPATRLAQEVALYERAAAKGMA